MIQPPWPQDLALDTPLWKFACQCWTLTALREQTLHLQSMGCSVNALLVAAWCWKQHIDWDGQIPEALAGWQSGSTGKLRSMRRSLPGKTAPYTNLYQALLAAELAAEQLELAGWYHWLHTLPSASADSDYHLQQRLTTLGNQTTEKHMALPEALLNWQRHLLTDWIPRLYSKHPDQPLSRESIGRSDS